MEQTEILQKIVLYGRAGEQDPPRCLQLAERRVCQIFAVFQPVSLITDGQPHPPTMEDAGMEPEGLVGDDEDGGGSPSAALAHKGGKLPVDLVF